MSTPDNRHGASSPPAENKEFEPFSVYVSLKKTPDGKTIIPFSNVMELNDSTRAKALEEGDGE